MMLYPLKFTPLQKQTLWGGSALSERLGKPVSDQPVGESWELCCRADGMSVVSNGPLKGTALDRLIEQYGEALLGSRIWGSYGGEFPLFFKFIDAAQRLSVQVHPDDAMAQRLGEPFGKEELWFVVDAPEDGRLIVGLEPDVTEQDCRDAVSQGGLAALLREVPVRPGEFYSIPPGTVHAILEGLLIAEIQQNSNTTYRFYDWGRLDQHGSPRQLHLEQALQATNFAQPVPPPASGRQLRREGLTITAGARVKEFQVDHERLEGRCRCISNPQAFSVLMVLEGGGELICATGSTLLQRGDTVLIPASLGLYHMEGTLSLLKTHLA